MGYNMRGGWGNGTCWISSDLPPACSLLGDNSPWVCHISACFTGRPAAIWGVLLRMVFQGCCMMNSHWRLRWCLSLEQRMGLFTEYYEHVSLWAKIKQTHHPLEQVQAPKLGFLSRNKAQCTCRCISLSLCVNLWERRPGNTHTVSSKIQVSDWGGHCQWTVACSLTSLQVNSHGLSSILELCIHLNFVCSVTMFGTG